MSDPQPPAWTPENDPNRAYGAPPPQPPPTVPLPQYAARPPQHGRPSQYGQPPQYGTRPPQYGAQSPQHSAKAPQYRQPPQYGTQPPQYGAHPPQYGAVPPHQPFPGGPQYPPPHRPPAKRKTTWLLVGAVTLVLALVAGTVAVLTTRGSDDVAVGGPMPTATYSDGVTSGETPSPTAPPSYTPEPAPTPTPTRTATPERRRTLKDIDKGIEVYDDVFVNPAPGFKKIHESTYSVSLLAEGRAAAYVIVSPVAYPARTFVGAAADEVIKIDHWVSPKKGAIKTMSPANSNIDNQAQISLSGRIHLKSGGSVSMVARCVAMTGVESIHNVSVVLCVEGPQSNPDAAYRDMPRMLASVARSI